MSPLSPVLSVLVVGVLLVCLLLAAGWLWRQFRLPRSGPSFRNPPSLRLQISLILLPVAGLAVGGFLSLARDRAAVEEDARRQAAELAEEMALKLSHMIPAEINEIEFTGSAWAGDGGSGSEALQSGAGMVGRSPVPWLERYPMPTEEVLPLGLRFAPDGALKQPKDYPAVPVPNPVSRQLGRDAAEAWQNIIQADKATINPGRWKELTNALIKATSDRRVRYQLQLLELRNASTLTVGQRVDELLDLARSALEDRIETDSGLPLALVALAEALRIDPNAGQGPTGWEVIRGLTFHQPSSLTPWSLERASESARNAGDQRQERRTQQLRIRWENLERRRALAKRLQAQLPFSAGLLTNLWFVHEGKAWFAVFQPGMAESFGHENPHGGTNVISEVTARIIREDLLARAIYHAVEAGPTVNGVEQRARPRLGTGMKLGIQLEGRTLLLPQSVWAVGPEEQGARVLSEATKQFQQNPNEDLVDFFERWPSHPRVTVQVLLTDPGALFAAQRRQQWLFGGMIFATAGVAGVGVWQVNRAFRRQLALNEQKSNFVSSVSHELRAPLASLRLLAEGLANGRAQDEAKRQEYAGFLVQETRRLGALVENVLDFARIEQNRKQYQLEPTDLSRLVTATVKLMEPLASERQVQLRSEIPPTDEVTRLELSCDGPALQQALVNLLDNALKHAPPASTVTVRLDRPTQSPPAVRLSVADSGPGIPHEDHARIFERFYRRGSELRRETQGIGLGLAIVKHIAEGHGGRVWVESEPGQGAAFILELPTHEPN